MTGKSVLLFVVEVLVVLVIIFGPLTVAKALVIWLVVSVILGLGFFVGYRIARAQDHSNDPQ